MLKPDNALALLERAAITGARCPQSGEHGLTSADTSALAYAGHIIIHIYAWNFRRITILTGPHAGKATAPAPHGQRPWKTIDINGVHTKRGTTQSGLSMRSKPSEPRGLTAEELKRL